MKSALAHGFLPTSLESIYEAREDVKVTKFFLINNSANTANMVINRVVDNEAINVIKVNLRLAPGWSIDILDPGDVWHFKRGDYIQARCPAKSAIKFIIDGE